MANEAKTYDLVVIGGGPAGLIGAATAAAVGRTVALVNSQKELGGAGINTGTLPSKTLREIVTRDFGEQAATASRFESTKTTTIMNEANTKFRCVATQGKLHRRGRH